MSSYVKKNGCLVDAKIVKCLVKNVILFFKDNHSRVILSGDEKTDYINASFIDVSAFEDSYLLSIQSLINNEDLLFFQLTSFFNFAGKTCELLHCDARYLDYCKSQQPFASEHITCP